LEAGEHLEELTFRREPGFVSVGPCLRCSSGGRVLFSDVFDVNIEMGRGRIGRPRDPNGYLLAF